MTQYIFEFIGTLVLVLLGDGVCANVTLNKSKAQGAGWVVIALAWGFAVMCGVLIAGPVSGAHLNPAVTLGLAIAGKFAWDGVLGYIAAQMLGGFAGAVLVYVFFKDHYDATSDNPDAMLGTFCTMPAISSPWRNFLSELIATCLLVFLILCLGQHGGTELVGSGVGAFPVTCVISYQARISCFPLNGGGFLIDNVQQGETIKDEVPWTRYSFTLDPGSHQLQWKYVNQLAEGDYENAFYIDDITVGNPFNVYRDDCTGNAPELIAEKVAEAHYVDYGWDALPIGQYKYGISNDEGLNIAWSECLLKNVMAVDETDSEVTGIRRITIVNTLGQVIYDASTNQDISTSILERFPEGIYIVRLMTDQGMVTKKVKSEK